MLADGSDLGEDPPVDFAAAGRGSFRSPPPAPVAQARRPSVSAPSAIPLAARIEPVLRCVPALRSGYPCAKDLTRLSRRRCRADAWSARPGIERT